MSNRTFNCYACGCNNPYEHKFCIKCKKPAAVASLKSTGKGVFPEGFLFPLLPCEQFIGSDIHSDVLIPISNIERKHLKLEFVKDSFYFSVQAGDPKVIINGKTAQNNMRQNLNPEGKIQISSEEFECIYFNKSTQSETENKKLSDLALDSMSTSVSRVLKTVDFNKKAIASKNEKEIFSHLIDAVLSMSGLDRAYAFKIINQDDELNVKELLAKKADFTLIKEDSFTISRSIMTKVLENQGSVFVQDADKEVNSTVSMANFNIKTIVCLPILAKNIHNQDELIGVIYADKLLSTCPLPSRLSSSLKTVAKIASSHLVRCIVNNSSNNEADKFKTYFHSLNGEISKIQDYLQSTIELMRQGDNMDKVTAKARILECSVALKTLTSHIKENS